MVQKPQQHTPGPWHTGEGNGDGHVFGPEGTRRDLTGLWPICQISGRADHPENLANARLIAAAPDLLEALVDLVAEFDRYDQAMVKIGRGHEDYGKQRERARQAIAKATGSPTGQE